MLKGLTKTSLWEFILHIQDKAKQNRDLMLQNNHFLNELFKLESQSPDSEDLRERQNGLLTENRKLEDENELLFNLHSKILDLSNEFSWNPHDSETLPALEKDLSIQPADTDYSDAILSRSIPINASLPFLKDQSIVKNIISKLIEQERYEECAEIKKLTLHP